MTFDELEETLRAREDVVIGGGVDEASVAKAAQTLGLTFPPALREYLMRFGHLELGHFEIYGLGKDLPEYLDLVKMTRTERTESGAPLPNDFVPLLNDGGGNLYCMGTNGDASGRIYFWDHADGPSQEPDERSSSLTDWVAELLTDLDSE